MGSNPCAFAPPFMSSNVQRSCLSPRVHLRHVEGRLPELHANTGVRVASEFVTVQAFPFYLVGERCSPWLVNSPGQGHQVTGQVFEVDGPALELMDGLERV